MCCVSLWHCVRAATAPQQRAEGKMQTALNATKHRTPSRWKQKQQHQLWLLWLTFSTSVGTMDRRSVWPASLTMLVNTTALFRDPSSRLLNRLFSLQQHKSCHVMTLAPSLFCLGKSCYVMTLPISLFCVTVSHAMSWQYQSTTILILSVQVVLLCQYHHPYSICASHTMSCQYQHPYSICASHAMSCQYHHPYSICASHAMSCQFHHPFSICASHAMSCQFHHPYSICASHAMSCQFHHPYSICVSHAMSCQFHHPYSICASHAMSCQFHHPYSICASHAMSCQFHHPYSICVSHAMSWQFYCPNSVCHLLHHVHAHIKPQSVTYFF